MMMFTEPPDEATQRKLVLLSKVLQNLANGLQFGAKEEYMATLNSFIVDNTAILRKFFIKVSVSENINKKPQQPPITTTPITTTLITKS